MLLRNSVECPQFQMSGFIFFMYALAGMLAFGCRWSVKTTKEFITNNSKTFNIQHLIIKSLRQTVFPINVFKCDLWWTFSM